MNEITKELLDALKPFSAFLDALEHMGGTFPKAGAVYGLTSHIGGRREITVEDFQKARSAIAKAEAALAAPQADADGWIPWSGGECPINNGVWFWLRFRNGHQFGPDNGAALWRWDHNHLNEGDIVAYRIAKGADK